MPLEADVSEMRGGLRLNRRPDLVGPLTIVRNLTFIWIWMENYWRALSQRVTWQGTLSAHWQCCIEKRSGKLERHCCHFDEK